MAARRQRDGTLAIYSLERLLRPYPRGEKAMPSCLEKIWILSLDTVTVEKWDGFLTVENDSSRMTGKGSLRQKHNIPDLVVLPLWLPATRPTITLNFIVLRVCMRLSSCCSVELKVKSNNISDIVDEVQTF